MTRAVALLLTVLTGASGLVYEVAWQKYLATLLGSHAEATSAVLGIFLGGLSAGYLLFGSVTRRALGRAQASGRPPRLLLLYGAVEAGIGLYALAFPLCFRAVQALSVALPLSGAGGFAADVLLTVLLIGPPAVLMGGTIPILTQALARSLADATRFHAFVYACNTAGAFVGALAAGFLLVPWLGLASAVQGMGLVNLGAGASFAALGLWRQAAAVAAPAAPAAAGLPRGFASYALVALLSGFAMMAIQTVLNRLGALAFGASQFTFSMLVAVFVLCIALGSFAVSALPRIRPGYLVASQWLLVALLALLYFPLQDASYWAHVLRSLFRDESAAFYPYWASAFLCILLLLALPVGLSGATLPLIFHQLRREVGDLGAVAGRLYSWNTLGSLLGALLGGHLLLLWLDLTHVYRVALGALAVAATLLTLRTLRTRRAAAAALAALLLVPLVAGLAWLPAWDQARLASGLFRKRAPDARTYLGPDAYFADDPYLVPFYDDDPTASISVKEVRQSKTLARSIHTNGKSDSAIPGDYPTTVLTALLPALLGAHERAFVIGYGTGVTAGELAALPGTREVLVAEISRGVMRAAPLFDYGNQRASHNPRLRVLRGDAYRALLRSEQRFDAILSEPSNPWVTGVEMLFSQEFLRAAKSRLTPQGMYLQWIHVYEMDEETIALVLRTYASVFEHVAVWYGAGPDLLLLGFNDPARALDLDRIEARASEAPFAAALRRAGIAGVPALLAHELLPQDVLAAMDLAGPLHTLEHPILSHRAARAFFLGGAVETMPPSYGERAARIGRQNSLLLRYAARAGGRLAEAQRAEAVGEMCRQRPIECTTLLAKWQHDDPGSPGLAAVIASVRGSPSFARHLQPRTLAVLGRLLGAQGANRAGPLRFAAVRQITELFEAYYTHAAPFERQVLADVWQRCRDGAGPAASGRCRAGYLRAERRLGPLGAGQGAGDSARAGVPRAMLAGLGRREAPGRP